MFHRGSLREERLEGLPMTLGARLGFLLAISTLVLSGGAGLLFRHLFLDSIRSVEALQAGHAASMTIQLLDQGIESVARSATGLASVEGARRFVVDRNPSFVIDNITGQTFIESGMDALAYLDSLGGVVYSTGYDRNDQRFTPFPDGLLEGRALPGGRVQGLLLAGGEPWIVATAAITAGDSGGPGSGTLLAGRRVDSGMLSGVSTGGWGAVTIVEGEQAGLSDPVRIPAGPDSPVLFPESPDTARVCVYIEDIRGTPCTVVIDYPRDTMRAGRASADRMVLLVVALGAVFGLATILALDLAVMRRLGALIQKTRRIGESGDPSIRTALGGSDELGRLSQTIDSALDRLNRAGMDIRASRQRFDLFTRFLPGYAFLVDKAGRLVFASEPMRWELLGGQEDWAGLRHSEIWPADVASRLEADDLSLLAGGRPISFEMQAAIPDRGVRSFLVSRFALGADGSGEILLGGIALDITDKLKAERELERAEKRNLAVLEAVPELLLILDRQGVVLGFHPGIGTRLAVPADAVVGTRISDLGMEPEHLESALDAISRSIEGRSVETFEYRIPSGVSAGWFECRMTAFESDSVICTVRDVTSRKRMESEMLRTQKEESISLMAGGIAHDFNNILSAIGGSLDLALLDAGAPEAGDNLRTALEAVDKARMMTRQLLMLAKGGEAGVAARVDLGRIVRETVRIVLSGSAVQWRIEQESDLPQVVAEEGLLVQVVSNIVVNARDAMDGRGTLVTRLWREDGTAGPRVMLEFEDSGPGIDPALLERIFDPYFTTKPRGSGLGLAVTLSIIRRSGGSLEVRSVPGRGAVFTIALPAA
jgi:signal transduction histidine kinase/HAMP domain-containing protein